MKFGQYELLERIAIGGMAEVYKGRVVGAEGFEKLVAIKRIQPDLIADERFVTMLLTEARIHSALSHRNIVQIHDLGISEEGEYFIVLEYVEGYDLRAIMESITSDGEIIPEALSLHIAAEVAQGLHFAHELLGPDRQPLGLIHRDVSPSNVLISFAGEVKLSDFGLAKRRHDRSVVGSLKGNLIYMSPEQARQAPLDRRTDVFSLGALLFELLTGKRLREITDEIKGWGEVAAGVVRSARSARPDLPPSFEALLNQALAAEPGRRFPDAATFGAAIRQLLSQMNTPVGPADLQVLLGLVKPPKRPRGELDRSKVIRLGPDAHRTRAASPALPPLSGRIAEPSPLDRLRSAQARTSPSGPPPRRAPAPLARTKSNDELDAYPPTPPPVAATSAPPLPGLPTPPPASAAAPAGPTSGVGHNTWAGGFSLSSPAGVPTSPRRRASPLGSTLVGPAPAPPAPAATPGLPSAPAAPEDRLQPPPGAVTPPGPIASRPRTALGREMARTLPLPPDNHVPPPRPREMAKTLPLPPESYPATPPPTPGPTPLPPPHRDWTNHQTPLPGAAAALGPTPPPAAVPAPRESAPSAPMWRPAESSCHLQPLGDPPALPRASSSRLPAFPIGLWRSVAVGVAAVLVIGALIVHVGIIPLEVLVSWKRPAQLYVASEPEGGVAKLDGVRLLDPTPTKIPVSRDRQDHVIEIEYPGYRAVRESVRFDRSVALSFMFTLEKEGGAEIAPVAPVRPPIGALPAGGEPSPGR
jgi:serine/threonine protein kinase